jgi:hypothetical protein
MVSALCIASNPTGASREAGTCTYATRHIYTLLCYIPLRSTSVIVRRTIEIQNLHLVRYTLEEEEPVENPSAKKSSAAAQQKRAPRQKLGSGMKIKA